MSIATLITNLSDDQKQLIIDTSFDYVKGGTFGGRQGNKVRIDPYLVDEQTMMVCTPFHFSTSELKVKPPARETYPAIMTEFTGDLRDYQHEITPDVKKALNKYNCTLLSLRVGWGKSIYAIYLSTILKFKTLIVVNKLVLVNQWIETVGDNTNGSIQFLKPKYGKKEEVNMDADYFIVNAMNIQKLLQVIQELKVGTLIVDELHLICAEQLFKNMYYVTPRYVIGLSATPTRPDGLDKVIKLYFGGNTITQTLYRKHTVYKLLTGLELEFKYQQDGTMDWNSLLVSQAEHSDRNQMIIDIIVRHPTRNFLVLCKRLSQGKLLLSALQELGESVTDMLSSPKKGEPAFNKDSRILIATGQKCSTGFSHNKLDALIMAADVEEYFIQYLGRVFRTLDVEPIIFDLVDQHPTLKRHFTTRRKVYQDAGGVIKKYT